MVTDLFRSGYIIAPTDFFEKNVGLSQMPNQARDSAPHYSEVSPFRSIPEDFMIPIVNIITSLFFIFQNSIILHFIADFAFE